MYKILFIPTSSYIQILKISLEEHKNGIISNYNPNTVCRFPTASPWPEPDETYSFVEAIFKTKKVAKQYLDEMVFTRPCRHDINKQHYWHDDLTYFEIIKV